MTVNSRGLSTSRTRLQPWRRYVANCCSEGDEREAEDVPPKGEGLLFIRSSSEQPQGCKAECGIATDAASSYHATVRSCGQRILKPFFESSFLSASVMSAHSGTIPSRM